MPESEEREHISSGKPHLERLARGQYTAPDDPDEEMPESEQREHIPSNKELHLQRLARGQYTDPEQDE